MPLNFYLLYLQTHFDKKYRKLCFYSTAGKIIIYEHINFHGRPLVRTTATPNLVPLRFNDIASSARVLGMCAFLLELSYNLINYIFFRIPLHLPKYYQQIKINEELQKHHFAKDWFHVKELKVPSCKTHLYNEQKNTLNFMICY